METYSEGITYSQIQAGWTKMCNPKFKENLDKYMLFEMDGKAVYKLAA